MLQKFMFWLHSLLETFSLFSIIFICAFTSAIILLLTNYKSDKKFRKSINSINGPPTLPFIGNAFTLLVPDYKIIDVFRKWSEKYGSIFRVWLGNRAYVFVSDPKICEEVLSSKVHLRKALEYDLLHPFLGFGLSTLNGSDWVRRRKLVGSIFFNFKTLQDFLSVFNEQSLTLIENLIKSEALRSEPFNIHTYITHFALNTICEAAMGRIRSDTDDIEYVKTVHEMCEVLIERILSPWLRPSFIWKLSAQGRREKKMQKILNNFIEKVIRQRKQHAKYTQGAFNFENEENGICKNYERKAFLDLLLEAAENNNLSDEDVRNETQTFIFGGHDTTASSLSWTLFLIASSPRVQKKLNVELQEIFGDDTTREVTLHDLSQMMYTECCIKEALRMYPSGPFYGRHLLEDLILGDGRILPANTSVFIAPILLHNNPEYFPNPETFLPERFYPENSHDRNKFSYIPFSAGPRNCIGQKFAMMEEKVVIANFFRRLVIEPVQKIEDVKYILELTLKPKDGPLVKICCKNIKPVSNSLLN